VLPEIHLGPLTIQTFGICFAVGFIVAAGVIGRRLRELDLPADWTWEMTFSIMVGGLVGSRLDYMVENWDKVKGDFFGSLFSGSGLVWYGGVIGGALGAVIWAWRRGWLSWALADLACIPLALGYAIGRCGCQLSGDGDYGKVSSLPTAMGYPHGTVPTPPGVTVLPTPIYETVAMGLVAWWLWRKRDAFRPGALFAFYLLLSGLERLLIEFIRRNHRVGLGMTVPQFESIALMIIGVLWLTLMARRGGVRLARAGATAAVAHA
jgi:phosphatidylglycerol:prolipoprotein diacylglycerol transferase